MVSNAMEKWIAHKKMYIAGVILIVAVFVISVLSMITLDLAEKVYTVLTVISWASGITILVLFLVILWYVLTRVKPGKKN